MADKGTLGIGLYFDDLAVGDTFRSAQRTLFEADLAAFCNLTWLTEELFARTTGREELALPSRIVPAALVYAFAEGLMLPMMQHTESLAGPSTGRFNRHPRAWAGRLRRVALYARDRGQSLPRRV